MDEIIRTESLKNHGEKVRSRGSFSHSRENHATKSVRVQKSPALLKSSHRGKTYRVKKSPSPVSRKGKFAGAVRYPTDKSKASRIVRSTKGMLGEIAWETYQNKKGDDTADRSEKLVETQAVRAVKNIYGFRQILKERNQIQEPGLIAEKIPGVRRSKSLTDPKSSLNHSDMNVSVLNKKQSVVDKQNTKQVKPNATKSVQSVNQKSIHTIKRKHTVKGLIRKNIVSGLKNFKGSDDAGVQAVTKTRDAVLRARRAIRAAKTTAKATWTITKFIARLVAAIGKAIVSLVTAFFPVIAVLLIVIVCIAVIASVIPQFSLKSDDVELTKVYKYITKLDAEFTEAVRLENTGAEIYHYYLNGNEISRTSFEAQTNADSFIAYLDSKYQDYAFDKFIYGIFGGTNVKEEIREIHKKLYSYTINIYSKKQSLGVNEDGEEEIEEKTVKDISIQTKVFDSWVQLNQSMIFKKGEYDTYRLLNESGVFTSKKEIGSPFDKESFQLADRYGYNFKDGIIENKGINIVTQKGKKILSGIKGTVTDVGQHYVTVSRKDKEIVYINMVPSVQVGEEINRKDILGKTSGDILHIDYYKKGKEMCPYIFISGISGIKRNTNGNMAMVEIALTQLGQIGGQPYWSWYGFGGRVEWCAIFVSWVADQAGYLNDDIIFKHSSCSAGVESWKSRGLWQARESGYKPKPGDLIYFLWTPGDYGSDHIGIVESSDENYVYTVEGNSGDEVRQNTYSLTDVTILGYATPLYPASYGKYTEEDLYWLSRVINAEAGSEWLKDTFQQDVGSVVLNRTQDSRYPDSIKDVIFQKGQYECVSNGSIYKEPSAKSIANAKYILEKGSTLPKGVVGQSQFVQGEIHSTYFDPILGTTTYFCYM